MDHRRPRRGSPKGRGKNDKPKGGQQRFARQSEIEQDTGAEGDGQPYEAAAILQFRNQAIAPEDQRIAGTPCEAAHQGRRRKIYGRKTGHNTRRGF